MDERCGGVPCTIMLTCPVSSGQSVVLCLVRCLMLGNSRVESLCTVFVCLHSTIYFHNCYMQGVS